MLFIECFGKNVYIDDELVGYISPDGDMFANGHKFGTLTHDGDIYDIYIREELAGYVTPSHDIKFDSKALMKAKY